MSKSRMFERRKQALQQRKANAGVDNFLTDRGDETEKMDTDDTRQASAKQADLKDQGRYVTLIQTAGNRLKLVPNPATIQEFIDDNAHHFHENIQVALGIEVDANRRHNQLWSDGQILDELLADFTSNGWQWVAPEEIGALTEAPILEAPDGRIYWHERYAIEAAGEDLLLTQTITFDGAPDNRPLYDPKTPPPVDAATLPKSAAPKRSVKKAAEEAPDAVTPLREDPATEPQRGPVSKYKYWTAEALSAVIEALSKVTDFANDKAAQQAVAEMAEELNSRPKITTEDPKVAARKQAALDGEAEKFVDNAIQGLYKFQVGGEEDPLLVSKALQELQNVQPDNLLPEQVQNLNDAVAELESYDEGNDGDIARAIVALEDMVGKNWSTVTGSLSSGSGGSFCTNEETGNILEGDKSIPDGRKDVEDHTGIVRPKTTTPSRVANLINQDTSKVLEGDKSIPDGRDKVEDHTGIQRPETEVPIKLATSKVARDVHQEREIDGNLYVLDTWQERDRFHISLRNETDDTDVLDFWDEEAHQVIEDGFISPKNWIGSALKYAERLGRLPKTASVKRVTIKHKHASEDVDPTREELLESGDAEECPSCGAVSAYAYDNVNYAPRADILGEGIPEDERIYHIPTASGFEWQCGNCEQSWTPEDSPLNQEVYTHDKEASVKTATIEHRPGHKDSKGEAAPWCNVKDGEVLDSHATKEEAEKALRDHEYFKGAASHRTGGKSAAEISVAKALKMSEAIGEKLKAIYLDAKPLTSVNGTRPVRDAVEAIYAAMALFGEAVSVFSKLEKQQVQEAIAQEAALPKKKSSSLLSGLRLASAE